LAEVTVILCSALCMIFRPLIHCAHVRYVLTREVNRRFQYNHFPGQDVSRTICIRNLNTLECPCSEKCSCSKIRRSVYATLQSHFNRTQSALFNCSLIETYTYRVTIGLQSRYLHTLCTCKFLRTTYPGNVCPGK